MKRSFTVIFMVFLAGTLAACTTLGTSGLVPLPNDIKIVQPDKSVSADATKFLGKWSGAWDGAVSHVLVVEEVTPTAAKVIYAIGDASSFGQQGMSWGRYDATLDGLEITITVGDKTCVYTLDAKKDKVYGKFIYPHKTMFTELKRVP